MKNWTYNLNPLTLAAGRRLFREGRIQLLTSSTDLMLKALVLDDWPHNVQIQLTCDIFDFLDIDVDEDIHYDFAEDKMEVLQEYMDRHKGMDFLQMLEQFIRDVSPPNFPGMTPPEDSEDGPESRRSGNVIHPSVWDSLLNGSGHEDMHSDDDYSLYDEDEEDDEDDYDDEDEDEDDDDENYEDGFRLYDSGDADDDDGGYARLAYLFDNSSLKRLLNVNQFLSYSRRRTDLPSFIASATCTCGTRGFCRHMAAVLYSFIGESCLAQGLEWKDPDTFEKLPIPEDDLNELIDHMSRDELKEMILHLASDDLRLGNHIYLFRKDCLVPGYQYRWDMQIQNIIARNRDIEGEDEDDPAYDMADQLRTFILQERDWLLERNLHEQYFELTTIAFKRMSRYAQEGEWTSVALTTFSTVMQEIWGDLILFASPDLLDDMYAWLREQAKDSSVWENNPEIAMTLFHPNFGPDRLLKSLDSLPEFMEAFSETTSQDVLLSLAFQAMSAMELPTDQVADFMREKGIDLIPRISLLTVMQTQAPPPATDLFLRTCLFLSAGNPREQYMWGNRLLDFLDLFDREKEYYSALKGLVFHCSESGAEDAQRLLELTEESERPELARQLLRMPKLEPIRLELLAQAEQYSELYQILEERKELPLLDRFADALQNWEPGRVQNLFASLLESAMDRARTRSEYRTLVNYLPHLARYPAGGRERAQQIAAEWRTKYPNRRVLQSLLRDVGY